jgi:hypothetical protein
MKLIVILLCLIIFIISLSNIYFYYGMPRPQGPKGPKGIKGDTGSIGPDGIIGDKGIRGRKGSIGIKGKEIGLKGETGMSGINGFGGDIGDQGRKGMIGSTGINGPPGIKGELGFKGKTGLEGPIGNNRVINDNNNINLIADRRKCIRIDAKDQLELKCPMGMAIFDIRAKKVSNRTVDSNIDNIICCNINMEPLYGNYFNKLTMIEKLNTHFGFLIAEIVAYKTSYVPNNMWHKYLKKYNEDDISKISSNIDKIQSLITATGANSFKSIREMPLEDMKKYFDEDTAKLIIEYTDEEIVNIINKYDSITSYEYYVLNLMLGLFKSKSIKNGSPIDTSNYERFIKEVYDFPKNDIESLENTVNYMN